MSTLSRQPQNVDDNTWYYEGGRGICVVHDVRDKGGRLIASSQIPIPWSMLRKSLERKDHDLAARRKRYTTAKRSVGKSAPAKQKALSR